MRLKGDAKNPPEFPLPPLTPPWFLALAKFDGLGSGATSWKLNWVPDQFPLVELFFDDFVTLKIVLDFTQRKRVQIVHL